MGPFCVCLEAARNCSYVTFITSFRISKRALRRYDVALALIAALLAILLLALGYARAWPLALDIGGQDRRFVDLVTPEQPMRGFHAVEPFGGDLARWTSGDATLALPRPPDGTASILALRLLNSRPAGQPMPRLEISADGQPIGAFEVPQSDSGMRLYRVLLPAGARLGWATQIDLRSDPITLPGDPRQLGLVADAAALAPLGAPLLPIWLLLVGAALGALGYAFPRSIGLGAHGGAGRRCCAGRAGGLGHRRAPAGAAALRPAHRRAAGRGLPGHLGSLALSPRRPTTDDRRPTTDRRSRDRRRRDRTSRSRSIRQLKTH